MMAKTAKTITADGVERIMTRMREAPQIDQRVLQQIDGRFLLRELQLCVDKFWGRGSGAFRLTEQNLKKLGRLKKLLLDLRNALDDAVGFPWRTDLQRPQVRQDYR